MRPLNSTPELFRHIVILKAQGHSWDASAVQLDQSSVDLEQLPWLVPQQWDEEYARAEELLRRDVVAQGVRRLNAECALTTDRNELATLYGLLLRLLKLQVPRHTRPPENRNDLSAKSLLPSREGGFSSAKSDDITPALRE